MVWKEEGLSSENRLTCWSLSQGHESVAFDWQGFGIRERRAQFLHRPALTACLHTDPRDKKSQSA